MENNKEKIKSLLEKYGWVVISENPLEIKHSDGSIATNQAAHYVIEHCIYQEDIEAFIKHIDTLYGDET